MDFKQLMEAKAKAAAAEAAKPKPRPVSQLAGMFKPVSPPPVVPTSLDFTPKAEAAPLTFAEKLNAAKKLSVATPDSEVKPEPVAEPVEQIESTTQTTEQAIEALAKLPATQTKPTVGPVEFQEVLNRFDALIADDGSISSLVMANARGYVQVIMQELVTHPEYDGMVIDRDVHNIMAFVQGSVTTASDSLKVKAVKRATKASNDLAVSTVDLSAITGLLESSQHKGTIIPAAVSAAKPATQSVVTFSMLNDMAKTIEAKVR